MAVTENEGGIETAYVLTPSYDRTYHANVEYPAKYVRVRVRNLSHLTAKNCLCELIKIETLDDGSFKKAPLFDSPRLAWNFEWDNAPPDQRRDISPQGALSPMFFLPITIRVHKECFCEHLHLIVTFVNLLD